MSTSTNKKLAELFEKMGNNFLEMAKVLRELEGEGFDTAPAAPPTPKKKEKKDTRPFIDSIWDIDEINKFEEVFKKHPRDLDKLCAAVPKRKRGDVVAMQKKYLLAYDMDVDDSDDETKVEPKPKKAKH